MPIALSVKSETEPATRVKSPKHLASVTKGTSVFFSPPFFSMIFVELLLTLFFDCEWDYSPLELCDDAFCVGSGQPQVPAGGPERGGHELGHNHVLPGISSLESQTIRTIRTLELPWKIVSTKPNDLKPEICGKKISALTCQIKFEPSCCKGLPNCCATGRAPCTMTCCGFCSVRYDGTKTDQFHRGWRGATTLILGQIRG